MRAIGWLITGLLVVAAITALSWGLTYVLADTKGKIQAQTIIHSGDYRIQAYEHFFNLCQAVQSDEGRLDAQFQALAQTKGADDRDRILTNIAGIQGDRSEAINQYNVDARKDYTEGQFRSSKLPFQLPATQYTSEGAHTSCEA